MSKSRKNRDIFNKEPQIFAKPHPSELHYDPSLDTNSFQAKAAPLRRKSPHSSKGRSTQEYAPQTIEENVDMQFNHGSIDNQEEVRDTRTTGFYKGKSEFSPSGVTSGFSERDTSQQEHLHVVSGKSVKLRKDGKKQQA
jgi:hypothetical protein